MKYYRPIGNFDLLNRFFYLLDLDISILYNDANDPPNVESGSSNDYTIYQLRSFSFARAQRTANERLHRLDELKATIGIFMDDEGVEKYFDLREEIIGSHAIELDDDIAKKLSKKEKKEHNKRAAQGLVNFIK